MKIHYDEEVDALYLSFSGLEPDGVIEISEGVNVDTTTEGKLTGIEILNASQKMDVNTIFTYSIELEHHLVKQQMA